MLELISRRLREVTVRPVVGADERIRWDALMGAHHYLPSGAWSGERARRSSASCGSRSWAGTLARSSSSPHRWIGWLPEQQFPLHLIANNARFLILPGCAAANLASRVLGLSLRRLSGDFHALHGHPVLIAETFVDRSRFTGACYRAANWHALGHTRGFARKPGTPATWVPHGRPKEVLVYPLARDAREQLCRLDDAPKWRSEGDPRPWTAHRLRSLWECLHGVPDFRSRGRRYPLATIVTIAVAAKLAGYHGATAIGELPSVASASCPGAFYSPRLGRFTAPSTTAFVKVLTNLDPDVLDRAARTWAAQQAFAIHGKYIRGAARHNPGAKHLLVAAAEHRGIVLGQEAVEDKATRSRPCYPGHRARPHRRVVPSTRTPTTTPPGAWSSSRRHYVIRGLAWLGSIGSFPRLRSHLDKGHGRIDEAAGCSTSPSNDRAPLPHRQVAFRIERERRIGPARSSTRPYTA